MRVHLNVTWSTTVLFGAGQRTVIIDWKKGEVIPSRGDTIKISTFIQEDYGSEELFPYEDATQNIYDWIERTTGWEVKELTWHLREGQMEVHMLVTD